MSVLLLCGALVLLVCPSAVALPGRAGSVELNAPSVAQVGRPIELSLRYNGGDSAAGYQASLRYDTQAAHLTYVENRGSSMPSQSGWDVRDLGPVELDDGVAFGGYSCLQPGCAGGAGSKAHPGGGGLLARIEVRADEPGPLELRLGDVEVVSPDGAVLASADDETFTIDVRGDGGGSPHGSPPAHPGKRPSGAPGPGRLKDATGDKRVDDADVTEAALSWVVSHAGGASCGPGTSPAVDVNGDGCVDVADVQTFAGAAGPAGPPPARAGSVAGRGSSAAGSSASLASTLVVNSVGDGADAVPGDGVCSTSTKSCTLRAAIQESNAQAGSNAVHFQIAGTGVHTIQLASALPTISDRSGGLVIDGYTQSGAAVNTSGQADNARLMIQVRGTGPSGVNGVSITSAANVLRGIAFYNLRRSIYIYGSAATGNTVAGCFVGTDAGGTFAHTSTDTFASGIGIEAKAAGNKIGTTALADRNVISGNARHGIVTYNEGSNSNLIYNNIIGLSPSGARRVANLRHGIDINAGSSNNVVGGTGSAMRNVISGNGVDSTDGPAGVEVSHASTTTGNKIVGNYIGTDLSGTTAASWAYNSYWGIHLEDGVNHTLISNNVIVGSRGGGIKVQDAGTTANQITNNRIGLTTSGQNGANSVFGVLVASSAHGNTVGPGNTIANNPVGVWIRDAATDGNRITRNSTYSNGGLGIDLDPFWQVNPNDSGDADSGANQQLNFPVISSARTTSVTGTACGGCTVEIYVADSTGPGTAAGPGSGAYGEGKTYLATTTASSTGSFSVAITATSGQWLTATATDSSGNTSEFGANARVS